MWIKTSPKEKIDVVMAAGSDEIETKFKDPILRSIILRYKRWNSRRKLNMKNLIYREDFYGPEDYKLLDDIDGKPLLQHTIDNIIESDSSWLANQLGVDNIIGDIIIVGNKESLESELVLPDDRSVKIIEKEKNIYENVTKGFANLFPDKQVLPDIIEGFYHIKDRVMQKKKMSWKTKARLEFYAEIANAIMQQAKFSGKYSISLDTAHQLVLNKRKELIKRYTFPQRLAMHEDRLSDVILGNPALRSDGSEISFENESALKYFDEFYRRNERFAIFVGGDAPFLNPGLSVAIRQFLDIKSEYDVVMSLAPAEAIEIFANDFKGKKRPYMHFEHLLRTANCHILRPNKIGNQNLLKELYGMVRLINPYVAIKTISKITYDPESDAPFWKFWKRFHLDNLILGARAFYNQKVIFRYLQTHDPSKDQEHYENMVKKYWKNRSNLQISKFDKTISQVFNTKCKLNILPSGLMTIDLDSKDVDKPSIIEHYNKWKLMENERLKTFLELGLLDSDKYREYLDERLESNKNSHLFGNHLNYFLNEDY